MAKPAECVYTVQEKVLYEHRNSEAWFSSYGLLKIKEIAQNIHLQF
jgi:hypothetical protein